MTPLNAKQNKDACLADLGFNTRQASHSPEGPSASRLALDRVLSRLDALGFVVDKGQIIRGAR